MTEMVLGWIAVALAFAAPLGVGISVQSWLERRDDRYERLVPILYLAIPMASAFIAAFLFRSRL
jgi:hypothetical protein